jgi:hypothetical protein
LSFSLNLEENECDTPTRFIQTCLLLVVVLSSYAQQSSARIWNETLLEFIRLDLARPTVHSRNLYHHSMAMYDAWAIIDGRAEPHFLGKTLGTYSCSFNGFTPKKIKPLAISEAINYASYRLMKERFKTAPRIAKINHLLDSVFRSMSGDTNFVSVDYPRATVNPFTRLQNDVREVKRGDFTRVLAEFWADGPSSETPPVHWFT